MKIVDDDGLEVGETFELGRNSQVLDLGWDVSLLLGGGVLEGAVVGCHFGEALQGMWDLFDRLSIQRGCGVVWW